MNHDRPAASRQMDAGIGPLEQRQAQLVFKAGDVAADRRCFNSEGLGGAAELPALAAAARRRDT
jgi:hypothetical protein